ncbi:MAG: hypothetical protein ACYTGA_11065 [Planctomycetota bacterium]|jgi:hypothetical protein|nr:hypothetical protein [Chloroflexota bacterium]
MAGNKYLRAWLLAGIYLLGFLGIVASGSGGGGGDDDDLEIIIQGGYSYLIGGPLPDGSGNSTIGIEQGALTLTTEPELVGTVICDQVTEVCGLQTVDEQTPGNPSGILIDYTTDTLFTGNLDVTVDDFWLYSPLGSDRPVNGKIRIDDASGSDIIVEVRNCTGGSVEVTTEPASTTQCFSWDDFEDLMDDPVSTDVQLKASLAWQAIAFIVDQALSTLEVFPLIVDDVFAVLGNPITELCDMYSDTWVGGPVNPGMFTFTKVSPDAFLQTFSDCWFGDSNDGTLLQGIIDYADYIQVIDQLGLLTRIGFGSVTLGDGVDPLDITETTKDINDDIVTEPTISLTGKYFIDFN